MSSKQLKPLGKTYVGWIRTLRRSECGYKARSLNCSKSCAWLVPVMCNREKVVECDCFQIRDGCSGYSEETSFSSFLLCSCERTGYYTVHRWVTTVLLIGVALQCKPWGGFPTMRKFLISFASLFFSLVLSKALLPTCVIHVCPCPLKSCE